MRRSERSTPITGSSSELLGYSRWRTARKTFQPSPRSSIQSPTCSRPPISPPFSWMMTWRSLSNLSSWSSGRKITSDSQSRPSSKSSDFRCSQKTVSSRAVRALDSPPRRRMTSTTSSSLQRAVPVNSMCSKKWLMPLLASVSLREPTGTWSSSTTVAVPGRGFTHTRRPLARRPRRRSNMPSSRSMGGGWCGGGGGSGMELSGPLEREVNQLRMFIVQRLYLLTCSLPGGFKQDDAPRHRRVERLGLARHGDAHPPGRQSARGLAGAGGFRADDEGRRQAPINLLIGLRGARLGQPERKPGQTLRQAIPAGGQDWEVKVGAHRPANHLRVIGVHCAGRQKDHLHTGGVSRAQDGPQVARVTQAIDHQGQGKWRRRREGGDGHHRQKAGRGLGARGGG